jgi:predicted MFS family arabinose efflux permease
MPDTAIATDIGGAITRNRRRVLLLLTAAYAFNAMDRGIISIIGQAMKVDLRLSDTQLGLLGGTAFAALYAAGGLPIARLAERANRVNIIACSLATWSALTTVCGLATSFVQLLLSRAGVGIAESGCTPPAHSLICDYFEPRRRATALSVYSSGISIGYTMAALTGGYVAQHLGWRAACSVLGLPGLVLAVSLKVFIREPPRAAGVVRSAGLREEVLEMTRVARVLIRDRRVLNMILGVTIGAFANYGFYAFAPLYFNRAFGLDYTMTGVIAALSGGFAVGLGIVAGGYVADRLGRSGSRRFGLVPSVGTFLATPLYVLMLLQKHWVVAVICLSCAGFFQYVSLGPTFGAVQNSVGAGRRATATALLYVFLNVVALGGGPLFTGWAIDTFAARADLATATRNGLLVTTVFYGWASLHYFRAAFAPSSVQSDSI